MARVRGLPTSWKSAARRSSRFGEVLSTTASVCARTSLCRWIGSCSSASAGSSGRNSSARPVRTTNHSATDGTSTMTILSSSSRMRSAETMDEPAVHALHGGRRARGRARARSGRAKRAARSMRSGSSPKEISGSSGVRSRPAARSPSPSKGSISSMSGRRSASALIVKSRRDRSTAMSSPKRHLGLARLRHVDLGPVRRDLVDRGALAGADRAEARALCPHVVGPAPHQSLDLAPGRASVVRSTSESPAAASGNSASRTDPPTKIERVPGCRETPRHLLGGADIRAEPFGNRRGLHPPTVVRPLASPCVDALGQDRPLHARGGRSSPPRHGRRRCGGSVAGARRARTGPSPWSRRRRGSHPPSPGSTSRSASGPRWAPPAALRVSLTFYGRMIDASQLQQAIGRARRPPTRCSASPTFPWRPGPAA